jgi:Gpi18-like mannosyltransferase
VFSLVWAAIGALGLVAFSMGRRVWTDPDWESGDWWALSSLVLLRGAVFGFLFPVVHIDHTRRQERVNAAWVMAWSGFVIAVSLVMMLWERSR